MDDNGKDKPKPMTEAEEKVFFAAERLKRYQLNPESFTEIGQIIICVKRSTEGLVCAVGGSEAELEYAWAKINRKIINVLNNLERINSQSKIVTPPKGSFLNFARHKR
jgi:hypothetical protein